MAEEQQDNGAQKLFENTRGATPAGREEGKVELDLDDSPFLDDDEPEQKPEPVSQKKSTQSVEKDDPVQEKPASFKDRLLANRKKLVLAGGAFLLLFAVAIFVNTTILSGGDSPAPPPPEPEKVAVAQPAAPQPPAQPPVLVMQLEPFWVELKDTEGDSRFLTLRFNIPTDNPALHGEMSGKVFILRDAIFYYLRNQPIISLRDDAKVQAFKGDLLAVMNEHLGSGKVSEILIQEYFVQ